VVIVVMGCAVAATPVRSTLQRAWFVLQLAMDDPPARLPSPVARAHPTLTDTWSAPRQGGRRHEGIDIFAPLDTPVVSTTRGLVTRVGTNTLGGNVVFVLGPGLESHYYAHLNRFGEIHPGDQVAAGDVLGYVGRTGNARTTPFHLHYGIYRFGTAQNPYLRLADADVSRTHERP
jgi:murein DD-endopeptidase MepM/ murein hydrolase activator NlpD